MKLKNPIIAATASLIFPGLGQIYNGDMNKGIAYIIMGVAFTSMLIFLIRQHHMFGPILASIVSIIVLWITNIYDAYNAAKIEEN